MIVYRFTAVLLPLPLGEVPQCAHWGGEGKKRRKPSQSPPFGGASSPRGGAKGGYAADGACTAKQQFIAVKQETKNPLLFTAEDKKFLWYHLSLPPKAASRGPNSPSSCIGLFPSRPTPVQPGHSERNSTPRPHRLSPTGGSLGSA